MDMHPATKAVWRDIGGYFFTAYGGETDKLQAANAICALGAVAGFCAQIQARAMLASGALSFNENALVELRAKDGGIYYLGEAINACLIQGGPGQPSFWNLMAGIAGDPDIADKIGLADMVQHNARALGTREFGVPRIQPRFGLTITPLEALHQHVGVLMRRFDQEGMPQDQLMLAFGMAAQRFVAFAAAEHAQVKVDRPLLRIDCVWLYMEAAIPMSKVDPRSIAV